MVVNRRYIVGAFCTVALVAMGYVAGRSLFSWRRTGESWFSLRSSGEASRLCSHNLTALQGACEMVGIDYSPHTCFMAQGRPGEAVVQIRGPRKALDLLEKGYIKKAKHLHCPSEGVYKGNLYFALCTKHGISYSIRGRPGVVFEKATVRKGLLNFKRGTCLVGENYMILLQKDEATFQCEDLCLRLKKSEARKGKQSLRLVRQAGRVLLELCDYHDRRGTIDLTRFSSLKLALDRIKPYLK